MIDYELTFALTKATILLIVLARILHLYFTRKDRVRLKVVVYLGLSILFLVSSITFHLLNHQVMGLHQVLDRILAVTASLILCAVVLGPLTARWIPRVITVFYSSIAILLGYLLYNFLVPRSITSTEYIILDLWLSILLAGIIIAIHMVWRKIRLSKLAHIQAGFGVFLLSVLPRVAYTMFGNDIFIYFSHIMEVSAYAIFGYVVLSILTFSEITPAQVLFRVTPVVEAHSKGARKKSLICRGLVYLVKESKPGRSFQLFVESVMAGTPGLCITRYKPDLVVKQYKLELTPIVWLTNSSHHKDLLAVEPVLEQIYALIMDFVEKSGGGVILLDGLEYLINFNDFPAVLNFLQLLRDKAAQSGAAVVLPIDERILTRKQVGLLERETHEL